MTTLEETIRKASEDAAAEWRKKYGPAQVRKAVHDRLDRELDALILALAGVARTSWGGRIDLDHCNGRLSVIDRSLREQARAAVDEWIVNAITKRLPVPTEELENALFSLYKSQFEKQVKLRISELCSKHSKGYADELFQKIIQEQEISPGTNMDKKAPPLKKDKNWSK